MNRIILAVITVATLITFSLPVCAEKYQGIGPFDTLGDVKARFPNAKFERKYPAWAKEVDAFYHITGSGLIGLLIINFHDTRPYFRQKLQDNHEDTDMNTRLADQKDEEALTVDWVRWVPDSPIPLERLISKYGIPDKKDFNDEMMPIRWWQRGLTAVLTDDEKKVFFIQYDFTKKDYREAWKAKHGYIPEHLKEEIPLKNQKKK